MVDPRHPDYDPANDPSRPVRPGPIERDLADPAHRIDPHRDPRAGYSSRGLAGATIAVAIVLLAVLAFAFMGGGTTDEAALPPGTVTEDPATTGAIEPDTAPVDGQAPVDGAAPVDGTAPVDGAAPAEQPAQPAPAQ